MDTYEKKYKEAVNKIKNLLDDGEKNGFTIVTYKTDLESIFPELKESEDERIRKEIIAWLKNSEGQTLPIDRYNAALAWLEKQGEVVSDNDDIEVEEKGIREAFNKIWEEKQDKQKSQRMISAEAKEAMYDKPAWSEDDEKRLQSCINILKAKSLMGKVDTANTMWLKSLKQRIGG